MNSCKKIWFLNIMVMLCMTLVVSTSYADIPDGKISGKLTESNGSTAIADAVILISGDAKTAGVTDASGDYEIDCLGTGTYKVEAWEDGVALVANDSVSVTNGQTTTCNLLAEGGAISGTVEDSSSTAIQGAKVTAILKANPAKVYKDTTDTNGDYNVDRLPAGTYVISVYASNYATDSLQSVSVTEDQETNDQDFTLGAAGSITGTIENSSQQAIVGAIVFATEDSSSPDADFSYVYAETDGSGNYTIDWLPTGTYKVFADASSYVSDSLTSISVTSGQTNSGNDFTLSSSGGTITGTVYESDGETPIENAAVSCYSGGKSWASTITNSSGVYSLSLLQAGTYTVTASAWGFDSEYDDTVVVTGTQTTSDIDFELD